MSLTAAARSLAASVLMVAVKGASQSEKNTCLKNLKGAEAQSNHRIWRMERSGEVMKS